MINVLELVYGGGLAPNPNPIHVYDPDRDLYEHADFYKEDGDFYQIVQVSENLTLYHFQKTEAGILEEPFEGSWWLKHDLFKRKYENREGVFYEKVKDRLMHSYLIRFLVIRRGAPIAFPNGHPNYHQIIKALS